jgi:VWFA-related protein
MNLRKRIFCHTLVLFLIIFSVEAIAFGDDFGNITKNIEKHYNAKKKKIPFLGLAGFFVKVARPAGVKNFKVAIYENQNFVGGQQSIEFDKSFRKSISKKWTPMVRSNSLAASNRTYLYTHQSGDDMEILSITLTNRQAIVAQAKVNPDSLVKFMEKPEIFGISLGDGVNSNVAPSLFGGFGGILAGQPNTYEDVSISTLKEDGAVMVSSAPSGPPSLKTKSDNAYNPLANDGAVDLQPLVTKVAESKPAEEAGLKLEARLINLNVKATDKGGAPLPSLRKEDFKVFEEGVEQDIFYFEPVNAPINLILLLDLSGSTEEKRKVMMETAKKFIDSLGKDDRVALAAFTREFVLLSDFSTDRKKLKKSVEKIKKIHGGTAFYDSMWKTLDIFRGVNDARQAIVVLTDGMDNELTKWSYEPSEHSFEELLARVAEEDATIYPIYLNSEEEEYQVLVKEPGISDARRDRRMKRLEAHQTGRRQLEELAEQTAGTVFTARQEGDLAGVYQRVASELRLLYTLAYTPKKSEVDGKFRKITVKLNHEGGVAKTRRGYYAK